jgi:hypothetical protein
MPDREGLTFEIDPRNVVAALAQFNKGIQQTEKGAVGAEETLKGAFQRVSDLLLRVNDRSLKSMESLTRAAEKQAAVYGRSGVERLMASRDQLIKQLGDQKDKIDRVTAAYERMIKQEERSEGFQGASQKAFLGAKDVFEGRNAYAGVEFAKSLTELKGAPAILGGVAGALAAAGFAAFEAAKRVGEYGVQIRDVQLRTGFTTKEVGQFGFAAEAAGQNVTIFERLMRGLSETLADNSAQSDKARETLKKLGASPLDLAGNLRPTSEILGQIGEGLAKISNPLERNKAAMDLFKKSGIEAIPVMVELTENLNRAKKLDLGLTDSQLKDMLEYKRIVTEIEAIWAKIVIHVVDGTPTPRQKQTLQPEKLDDAAKKKLQEQKQIAAAGGEAVVKQAAADLGKRVYSGLEGQQAYLEKLKKSYDEARTKAQNLADSGAALPVVAKQYGDALDAASRAYQRQSEYVKELQKDESKRLTNLEKLRDLIREGGPDKSNRFFQIGTGESLGAGRISGFATGEDIAAANTVKRPPSLVRPGEANPLNAIARERLENLDLKEGLQVLPGQGTAFVSPNASRTVGTTSPDTLKIAGEEMMKLHREDVELRLSGIAQESEMTIRLLELRTRPGGEMDTARAVAGVRQQALQQEFDTTGDIVRFREGSLRNEIDLRMQAAEIDHKHQEEVKRETEGLLHTLFTKPSQFGKQLFGTVRDAALKPVENGLSNIVATFLSPKIFGSQADTATNLNTQATIANTAALYAVGTAIAGGAGAGAVSAIAGAAGGGGGWQSLPLSLPSVLAPGLGAGGAGSGGAGAGGGFGLTNFGSLSQILGGPGGTSGFAGPVGSIGGDGAAAGGASGGGGILSTLGLGNLKNTLGQLGNIGMGNGIGRAGIGGMTGGALLLGGGTLAAEGLIHGGWSGVGMTTAGGALIGAKFGGPLGAAIGAGVGFAAGLIRLGFEGKEQEAKKLVKQLYGVSIDSSMAKQIVDLAKQKYAGHVSIAVRDPDVRKMIELYAAGTGQKVPLSGSTPRAASIVEQGGRAYQAPTYQYGQAYAYSSSLPTAGGGSPMMWPGQSQIVLNVNGQSAADLLEGRIASTVTPGYVQDRYSDALASSDRRQANAAMLQQAGLIVA